MTTPTHDTTSPTREGVARAICKARGEPPDMCVMGPGHALLGGGANYQCYRYRWHDHGPAADAILALFAPALAAAEKRGMERAITLCAPHEDDDAMDRQAKAHCVAAIRVEMEKM